MLFNSYAFVAVFLPLAMTGFVVMAGGPNWWLLASLAFYALSDPGSVVLPVSLLGNYLAYRLMTLARQRTLVLALATGANLAALAWYKYLPADPSSVLPLGISFFTFTQIGFLLDAHAGLVKDVPLSRFALLVAFFPTIVSGPILTARDVLPQWENRDVWRPSAEAIGQGSGLFLIGLLKKSLLADPLAPIVAAGFDQPHDLTLLPAWQAALGWSLQLYFDFSGYSDMAIGLARMLNLRVPVNFASPYKAQSVIEYWQRWHMTLTRFLIATIYTPVVMAVMRRRRAAGLGVGRDAQRSFSGFVTMQVIPVVLTMALAGIWHGSGVTYLVFGLLHATYLAVNHAWRLRHPGPRSGATMPVVARVAVTYLAVLAAAVVFRAPTLTAAGDVLAGMLGWHGISVALPDMNAGLRAAQDVLWLAALYGIVWFAPNSQQIMGLDETAAVGGLWRPTLPWAAAFGCAATLGLLSLGGTGEFLYFRF